ncbi:hypothetical protein TWF106_008103 [Orbilia oligospora]|uniref:Uncharacterized protein n=1 Tax=Orbilia oligospora TaxID=2813651 RepID=A0A7C8UTA1_ORBOL|nr:hypothetical protein TWF106_008103 [Orbilia oligospora]
MTGNRYRSINSTMFAIISVNCKAIGRGILHHLEHFPKKRKQRHRSSRSLLIPKNHFSQLNPSSASSSEADISLEPLKAVGQHFLTETDTDTEKVILEIQDPDTDHIDTAGIYCIAGPGCGHEIGITSVSLLKKIESWLAETLPPDSCLDEKRALIAQDNLEALFDCALAFYEAGKRSMSENANRNYLSSEDIQKVIAAAVSQSANPEFRERLLQNFLGNSYAHGQCLPTRYKPQDEIQPGAPDSPPRSPSSCLPVASRDQFPSILSIPSALPNLVDVDAQHMHTGFQSDVHIVTQTPQQQLKPAVDSDIARAPAYNYDSDHASPLQFDAEALGLGSTTLMPQHLGSISNFKGQKTHGRHSSDLVLQPSRMPSPEYESTQLHDAIKRDDLPLVQSLLGNKFDIFKDNVHTAVARLPANAIADCVQYRRKDILSYFINHDVQCYPTAIWETLRSGDSELRKFITAKYEERKRQLPFPKPGSYQDRFLQPRLCGGESLGYSIRTPLPKTPTRGTTYNSSTQEQWSEDFDTDSMETPSRDMRIDSTSQSEFNIEEYEGVYHSGSDILSGQEVIQEDGGEGPNGDHSIDGSGLRIGSSQQANRAPGKRSRSQRENNHNDDEDQNGPPDKRRQKHDMDNQSSGKYKCPFYELDSIHYEKCHIIARTHFSGIKEHLKRNHFQEGIPDGMFKNKTREELREFCRALVQINNLEIPSSTQPTISAPSSLSFGKVSTMAPKASSRAHAYANQSANPTPYQTAPPVLSMAAPSIVSNSMIQKSYLKEPISETTPTSSQGISMVGDIDAAAAQFDPYMHQLLHLSFPPQLIPPTSGLNLQTQNPPTALEPSFVNMATDVSHAPTQLNLLGSTPTHGLGRPFYATMDSSSTQSTIFPEEMPAFKMGPPPNTSPLYLGGAGMPVMTATMAPGPSLREIESILKQSSQESEKPYPSASRPDLGPGSSILEQNTDLIATTPQFSNPSSSPPGPGKSRKREIKVKLEEPQEGPERKRWYTLTVNDEDDVIRNLDRRMAEIFRPLQIYFSWDQYDLQKPKTKQRVCNLEELVEELVENQWGALERKISWFYLVQKGRKAAHD